MSHDSDKPRDDAPASIPTEALPDDTLRIAPSVPPTLRNDLPDTVRLYPGERTNNIWRQTFAADDIDPRSVSVWAPVAHEYAPETKKKAAPSRVVQLDHGGASAVPIENGPPRKKPQKARTRKSPLVAWACDCTRVWASKGQVLRGLCQTCSKPWARGRRSGGAETRAASRVAE